VGIVVELRDIDFLLKILLISFNCVAFVKISHLKQICASQSVFAKSSKQSPLV